MLKSRPPMSRQLVLLVAGLLALTACGLADRGSRPAALQPAPPVAAASPAPVSLSEAIARAHALGVAGQDVRVELTLGLRGRHPEELAELLKQGRTVTAAEFDRLYSPDPALVRAALAVLSQAGLNAGWTPGASLATAGGPAPAAAALFGVSFQIYQEADGSRFYAADRVPPVPAALAPVVADIGGLDSYGRLQRHSLATIRPGGLTPDDVLTFYNIKALRDQGLDGSGEVIVMPEIGDLPNTNDIAAYAQKFGLPPFDVTLRKDPAWGTPLNPGKPDGETMLDLEVIHAIAPGAKLVVYAGSARFDQGTVLMDAMVRENPNAIISDSLGACELFVPASIRDQSSAIMDRSVAQGMSHFVASGDTGAYDCGQTKPPAIDFPSGLPQVTSVGGTTLFLSKEGTYFAEAAWGNPIQQSGGGGGISAFYARPDWQKGPGTDNQFSNGRRQVPDVAGVADSNTGWDIIVGGRDHQIGGTSAAAPLWAGVAALVNQSLKKKGLRRIGFANPALYWMGQNQGKLRPSPFHDVTAGNNLAYPATANWDNCTGWGSLDAVGLQAAFEAYIRQGGK